MYENMAICVKGILEKGVSLTFIYSIVQKFGCTRKKRKKSRLINKISGSDILSLTEMIY